MNKSYKLHTLSRKELSKHLSEGYEEAIIYALLGKKSPRMLEWEKKKNEEEKQWNNLISEIKSCCHCKNDPELKSDIDCGIDGGPGPCTIYGLQIKCSCGMSGKLYTIYGESKLECLKKAVKEWNEKK